MSWWQPALAILAIVVIAAFIVFAMRQGEKVKPGSGDMSGGG
jgi:hypothetical protein